VGRRSPGALDNASGVVTVIAAARQLGAAAGIGVLLTDGEELGLAGARAWSISDGTGETYVLNCDGVDDNGRIEVMYSPGHHHPYRLLRAVEAAGSKTSIGFRAGRLIPAVLTDSAAFADAGMEAVTFSRGSWRSLARVHTTRDDLKHLDGAGIGETARLIAESARQLTEV
jgi:Zn-dependent M28 family amino/carboxypeptidase